MRYKRRYFCIEVVFTDDDKNPRTSAAKDNRHNVQKLKHTVLADTIDSLIEKLYGDMGVATIAPSFSVIYFNTNTNIAIVRAAREAQKKFHALLTFIQKLGEYNVAIRVIHISGSVKKCKQFLIGHCERKLASLALPNTIDLLSFPQLDEASKAEVHASFRDLTEACKTKDNSFITHEKP